MIAMPAIVAAVLASLIRRFAPGAGGANLARVRRAYGQEPGVLDTKSIVATLVLSGRSAM